MKFTKKLSLLLGAAKAMKPQKNDNETSKEGNINPGNEPEEKSAQSVSKEEVTPDNVQKQASPWGKLSSKDQDGSNDKKDVLSEGETKNSPVSSLTTTDENSENLLRTPLALETLEETDEQFDDGIQGQITSTMGKNILSIPEV